MCGVCSASGGDLGTGQGLLPDTARAGVSVTPARRRWQWRQGWGVETGLGSTCLEPHVAVETSWAHAVDGEVSQKAGRSPVVGGPAPQPR